MCIGLKGRYPHVARLFSIAAEPKERDEWIVNDAKLWLDTGSMFGIDGEDFERINVACPRKILEEGSNLVAVPMRLRAFN